MITYIRTAAAMPGKFGDLLGFAHKADRNHWARHRRKAYDPTSFGGQANQVAWISAAPSLASMEGIFGKLMASAEYRDCLKTAEHLIVPGSVHDHVWTHV